MAYSINGGEAVVESVVLSNTLENGAVIEHTFSQSEDFRNAGRYEIAAYTIFPSDLIPTNDIILVNVDHFGSPLLDIGQGQDTIVTLEPITLAASTGYPSYLWQDGSTEEEYYIPNPSEGLYVVSVTAENECVTRDSVYVAYDLPDIALTQILSPVSSCYLDDDLQPSLEILNHGYYRISSEDTLILTYSVDGGSSVLEKVFLESNLNPGQSTILTFDAPYDFSGASSFQFQASVLWTRDGNRSNNVLLSDVELWDLPVAEIAGGEDTLLSGLPVTLDAGSGFSSYLWQDNFTSSSYEVTEPGLYWVEVTNIYGCADRDSVYLGYQTAIQEDIVLLDRVRIYPNPAHEVLNVVFNLDHEEDVILELYTITNSLIYREDFRRVMQNKTRIDVQDLAPGSYVLRIMSGDQLKSLPVIIR